jgi:hypothetical protein
VRTERLFLRDAEHAKLAITRFSRMIARQLKLNRETGVVLLVAALLCGLTSCLTWPNGTIASKAYTSHCAIRGPQVIGVNERLLGEVRQIEAVTLSRRNGSIEQYSVRLFALPPASRHAPARSSARRPPTLRHCPTRTLALRIPAKPQDSRPETSVSFAFSFSSNSHPWLE